MNSYETLFFPDTDIFNERYYPLLLFFSPLHFLQLIEQGVGGNSANESGLFLEQGLCKTHTPAPLGENRQQFLRLIDDIRNRKEHYLTQLKIISPGSTTGPAENKKNVIISSLLQEFGIKHQASDQSLWRARLVLAMAEILASEEEALHEEFSEQVTFFNEEITALRSLQEAKGTEEVDLLDKLESLMAELEKPRLQDSVNRTDAWLRLLKNQPPPSVKMWLAATRDSGEQIFTRYESISHTSAVPVLRLAVPAYIDASGKYVIEIIEKFQNDTIAIHHGLVADFDRIVSTIPYLRDSSESLLPFGTDWAELWEGKLDKYFPASRDGRNHVTFYLLPGQPLSQLLSLPNSSGASNEAAHGLLGILGS